MHWYSTFTLVAAGFILGGGVIAYLLGRSGNRIHPLMAFGQIALACSILALQVLPSTTWAALLGVVLAVVGTIFILFGARPES